MKMMLYLVVILSTKSRIQFLLVSHENLTKFLKLTCFLCFVTTIVKIV